MFDCRCEYADHFDLDDSERNAPQDHEYGLEHPFDEFRVVTTPWGRFQVCEFCAETHLVNYPLDERANA